MIAGTNDDLVAEARRYLMEVYLPKVERSLERLTDEQIWWRPNEHSNSVGNLVLHLAGSTRMWVVSGVGGAEVGRDRQQEFDERSVIPRDALLKTLRSHLSEADAVLKEYDAARLSERHVVRGDEGTALKALFHAVERFSMHAGQIILLTKLIVGADLKLSD